VRFCGLIEGVPRDRAEVERAAAELRALGVLRLDLQLDRGRFSALLEERALPGAVMTAERQQALLAHLESLARAGSELESTLRRTEVYEDIVVETLFTPSASGWREVQRIRPVEPSDLAVAPGAAGAGSGLGRRRLGLLAIALALALGLIAWQSGIVDRVASAPATTLEVREGPFARLVSTAVEPHWGSYRVRLRRGADYPITTAEAEGLAAAAGTPLDRAAVGAVVGGRRIHARLLDRGGALLGYATLPLAPLLDSPAGEVEAVLPGRRTAAAVELALEPR
jgi:hypothetical protein